MQESTSATANPDEPTARTSPAVDGTLDNITPPNESTPMSPSLQSPMNFMCEMCQNYETNLTIMQDGERRLKEELKATKELADRYQKELIAERDYRKEMEKRMTEETEVVEGRIKDVFANHAKIQSAYELLTDKYNQLLKRTQEKSLKAREKLERSNEKNLEILAKYRSLLGENRTKAKDMREEIISLPDDIDLQFQCLALREQLIESRAAREYLQAEKEDECTMLRAQLQEEAAAREALEKELGSQITDLQTELAISKSGLSSVNESLMTIEEQKKQILGLQTTIAELEAQVQQVQDQRKAVEQTGQNYKARCSSLQQELDTCEAVQKDFVKLSQSLQIQLEKIRQSEQEVRWQFDEDADNCQECSAVLNKSKPKPHCRHCGRIFCAKCLSHSVPAGPSRRMASVCQVCHTLLNRESAPFFSRETPK